MIIIGTTSVAVILSANAARIILNSKKIIFDKKFHAETINVSIAFETVDWTTILHHFIIPLKRPKEPRVNRFFSTPNVRELQMF